MAKFTYKVFIAEQNRFEHGEMEASTEEEVAQKLRRAGFTPVEIELQTQTKIDFAKLNVAFERVKPQEMAFFTEQFATMIQAGMSPLRSLEVVGRGTKNQLLKRTVEQVRADINQGATLAQAMRKHPKVFNALYVSLVQAGEVGGALPEVLNRLADMLQKAAQLKREVRSAMIYPTTVITFAIVIFFAMMFFVVPAFQDIFDSNGGELPMLTQVLVKISAFVKQFWFLMPLLPAGLIFGVRRFLATADGRRAWDQAKFKIPRINDLTQKIVTARVMRTLATLLESGVPILQSMDITGPVANNVVVEEALKGATQDIKHGADISTSLARTGVFPDMAMAMLLAGDESGELNRMLNNVAEVYELEVQNSIKTIKSIMEPVMMIGIGGIIGVTVVGLYLPIFKVYNTIK